MVLSLLTQERTVSCEFLLHQKLRMRMNKRDYCLWFPLAVSINMAAPELLAHPGHVPTYRTTSSLPFFHKKHTTHGLGDSFRPSTPPLGPERKIFIHQLKPKTKTWK